MIPRANRIAATGSAPNTPGKRALRLWLRMLSCTNMIEQEISRQLRDHYTVTLPQFDVMSELEHAGQPLTMTQLSQQLMVSKGNITGLIDRLERDKLVARTPSTDDGRVLYISLTHRGAKLFDTMARAHEKWLLAMFQNLCDEDQSELVTLLKQTKDALTHYKEHA